MGSRLIAKGVTVEQQHGMPHTEEDVRVDGVGAKDGERADEAHVVNVPELAAPVVVHQ